MYFFKSPNVYSHCDQVLCRSTEEFKGTRYAIGNTKKNIINDYFLNFDLDFDRGVVFIRPERPLLLDLTYFTLMEGEGEFEHLNGFFDLDFFNPIVGFFVCSKRFKDFIEDKDPGVHSFWLIEIEGLSADYYLMFVGRIVVFDKSKIERCKKVFFNNECHLKEFELVREFCIWTFKDEYSGVFFRDDLKDEIIDKGFKGFVFDGESLDDPQELMSSFYNGFRPISIK